MSRHLISRVLHPDYAHDPDLPAAVQVILWAITIGAGTWTLEAFLTNWFSR